MNKCMYMQTNVHYMWTIAHNYNHTHIYIYRIIYVYILYIYIYLWICVYILYIPKLSLRICQTMQNSMRHPSRCVAPRSDSRLSRVSWVRPQRHPKAAIQRWYMYKCDNKRYSPSRNRITRNRESVWAIMSIVFQNFLKLECGQVIDQ